MASGLASQPATRLQQFFDAPDRLDALKFEVTELAAEFLLDGHNEADHHDRIPTGYVFKCYVLGQSREGAVEDPGNEILSVGRRGWLCGHVGMMGLRAMSLRCTIVRRAIEGDVVRRATLFAGR